MELKQSTMKDENRLLKEKLFTMELQIERVKADKLE